ncbi:SemiSWEET family transporter [Pediococcus acidilactici]
MQEETKVIRVIGRMASVLSVLMYVSYIPQIISNMNGDYGNPIQPLVAGINCTVWTIYGYFKAERDWPIIVANVPGIFLRFFTFYTALH